MSENRAGEAVIEDGAIVIRVPLDYLPTIVEGAWAAMGISTRLKITDVDAFAKELVGELNREGEDGTTPIHTMFDRCIEEAAEQGAEGVVEHEDQDA